MAQRPCIDLRVRLKPEIPADLMLAETLGKLCAGDAQSRASAARRLMLIGCVVISGGDPSALTEGWKLGEAPSKEKLLELLEGLAGASRYPPPIRSAARPPVTNRRASESQAPSSESVGATDRGAVSQAPKSEPSVARSGESALNKLRQMGRTYRREDIQS